MILIDNFSRRYRSIMLGAVLSSILVSPTAIQAQALEEIVVTAQRREQSLQDVPISLEVVSGEDILEQGYQDMTMLQSFTPNLDIRTSIDQPSTKIRGVGTVGDNFGFEQAVPMFVDGEHYGRGTQITNSFLDIERIEVLRGPQPVYFGQNATAGAISLTTRKPTAEWEGYANASYGTNDTKNVEIAGGGPVTDTIGIRAAGKYEASDGYLKSVWTGDQFPSSETFVGRFTTVWAPTDAIEVTGKVEYLDLKRGGLGTAFFLTDGSLDCRNDFGMCVIEDPTAYGIGTAHPIPTNGFTDIGTGSGPPFWSVPQGVVIAGNNGTRPLLNLVPLIENPPADLDLRRSSLEWGAFEDVESKVASLNMDYHFANDLTLTSKATYIGHDRSARDNQPSDNGPYPARKTDKWELVDQWNFELRLTSATGGFLEWMTGVYVQDQDMNLNQISVRAEIRAGAYEEGLSFQDSRWKSAFASMTFNVRDDLSLDLGGRYTDVDKTAGISPYRSQGWLCSANVLCSAATDAGRVPVGLAPIALRFNPFFQDYDTRDFNWQTAIRWRPTDDISTYARYANSFKAGGFDFGKTLFTPDIVNTFKFEDEFVDSWELGAKGTFLDGRANAEVTFFWSEFTDLQMSAFDTVREVQRALNVAEQRARGVEVRGSFMVTDRWQIDASGALLDGEMLAFPGATCTEVEIDQNRCLDQQGNPDPGGTIDRTGQTPPRSPDWQFVVNSDYRLPVMDVYEASFNAQVSFTDDYILDDTFSQIVTMPSGADLNLSLGFGPQDGLWKLSVYGRNLTEPLPEYNPEFDLAPDGIEFADTTRSMYRTFGVQYRYNFQ